MVEFAMVFPLLLLVILGIVEFSRMLFVYTSVVSASREASRYGAAIQDVGGGIPQYEDCQGIKEAALRVGGIAGIDENDIQIQYADNNGVYASVCPPGEEVSLADRIVVTISTTIQPLVPILDVPPIPVEMSSNRTILKEIAVGRSGTGAGSISGAITDVNFKTTSQTAEETRGTLTAEVILNQAVADDVTVPFSFTGTAVEGDDFSITSSPLIIPAGSQSATIYISLHHDQLEEGEESLILGLDTPTNATKGPQNIHTITIQDPPKVFFSENSSSNNENSGQSSLKVELSKASSQDITIPAGSLSAMITVTIQDDTMDEYDEQAVIDLDTPSNAVLGSDSRHTMTIVDDDNPPDISFYYPSLFISEEVGTLTTTVYLSNVSAKEIQVPYIISGTTTQEDYLAYQNSPITIPAGMESYDLKFDILEGDGWEVDETMMLKLENPTNASVGLYGEQTITITENTETPSVSFDLFSSTAAESDHRHNISVRLSNGWFDDVYVYFSATGSMDQGSGGDYLISSSPLIIPSGYLRGEITLDIFDDVMHEENESIIIAIDSVENGYLGESVNHTVTVTDNDPLPELSFTGSQQTAPESNTTLTLEIQLSRPSSQSITVPFSFTGTASSGTDYEAASSQVTIPAGITSTFLSVDIKDDSTYDPDETIQISMGTPTNAALADPSVHTIKIQDDELPPCQIDSSILTVGTKTISWDLINRGENVNLTGGSITWPETLNGSPRLTNIYFDGSEIYAGNDKPPAMSFTTATTFFSQDTNTFRVLFKEELGVGDHWITLNFQNPLTGDTCSQSTSYTKH